MKTSDLKKEYWKLTELKSYLKTLIDSDFNFNVTRSEISDVKLKIELLKQALLSQKQEFEKMIDKCKSHSWEGHKCILVEELKSKVKEIK